MTWTASDKIVRFEFLSLRFKNSLVEKKAEMVIQKIDDFLGGGVSEPRNLGPLKNQNTWIFMGTEIENRG